MKKSLSIFLGAGFLYFVLSFVSRADVLPEQSQNLSNGSSLEARLAALEAQSGEIKQLQEKLGALENENALLRERISNLEQRPSGIAPALPSEVVVAKPEEKPLLQKDLGEFLKQEKTLVKVGTGKLNISGLDQIWFVIDDPGGSDTFRLRRGEIKLSGEIIPKWEYALMFDPAKSLSQNADKTIVQGSRVLQDLFMTLKYIPHHKVDIGQYKLPLIEEGLRSSAKLDTIERSFIGRTFGDHRDIGVMITGEWEKIPYLSEALGINQDVGILYQGGVFNGEELNTTDIKDKKDFAGRVVLKPIKGLEVGGSGYLRTQDVSEKKRVAAEARYEFEKLSLKGEYAHGQTGAATLYGWYTQVGYMFLPKLQGVFKLDFFEPDERVKGNKERDYIFGLNYFVFGNNAKVQLNYVLRDREDKSREANQVLAAMQVAF